MSCCGETDTSSADFPGIYPVDDYFTHPLLTNESHPHLKLDDCMISMPRVKPGDMVYWHCVRLVSPNVFQYLK